MTVSTFLRTTARSLAGGVSTVWAKTAVGMQSAAMTTAAIFILPPDGKIPNCRYHEDTTTCRACHASQADSNLWVAGRSLPPAPVGGQQSVDLVVPAREENAMRRCSRAQQCVHGFG